MLRVSWTTPKYLRIAKRSWITRNTSKKFQNIKVNKTRTDKEIKINKTNICRSSK